MFPLSHSVVASATLEYPLTRRVPGHTLEYNQEFLARMRVNSSTTSFIGSSKKSNRA